MDRSPHILVVDDDAEIRSLVSDLIKRNDMTCTLAANAAQATGALDQNRIDLIVLDLMMPGEDGLSFCRTVRERSRVPIIMLTALGEDVDRIVGLEMGADDYLAKPFHPRELLARIKTVLRRAPPALPGETRRTAPVYRFGEYTLDAEARVLTGPSGEEIKLTSGEFALLIALIEHAPRVMSRDQLLDMSRGAAANPFDRSIDSQISRLRKKIEVDARSPKFIKTIRNLGYAFVGAVNRESGR